MAKTEAKAIAMTNTIATAMAMAKTKSNAMRRAREDQKDGCGTAGSQSRVGRKAHTRGGNGAAVAWPLTRPDTEVFIGESAI